jgi:hypothetical protein
MNLAGAQNSSLRAFCHNARPLCSASEENALEDFIHRG